ncbi:MAG: RNA methyltransferase [Myxococcota bacterium]
MRVDDPGVVEVEGPPSLDLPPEVVIAALSPVVTDARRKRIQEVVAGRTDDVVLVLDSITDPHNASAVLRSADAFGIQTVHVIVGDHGFRASDGVSKGTHRWLDVIRYESAASCAARLSENGYHLYVAAMGADHTPADLPREHKLALVFGNEHQGVSQEMAKLAHGSFSIPMRGFVESLNVSVAAAISMQNLAARGFEPMSRSRRQRLEARFLMNSVRNADTVIRQFLGNDEPR